LSVAERYLDLLSRTSALEFSDLPRPGWAGAMTLFSSPAVDLFAVSSESSANYVVAGVPFDSTASSRPGAAEGPLAIRAASRTFAAYLSTLGEHEMVDTRTGRVFRYRKPVIVDAGDLHVFPTDPKRNFVAIASEAELLASSGATPVFLGGDHSVAFPLFAGVQRALVARGRGNVGYVQVDHHFDFGMESAIHGPLYHGSNARRNSEVPGMRPESMAFIGVGAPTRRAQLESLRASGSYVVPATELRARGTSAIAPILESMRCDAVYLSIDIDVLDAAHAPGTGYATSGGLDVPALADLLEALSALPISAIDLVEVAPRYDPTGRTAQFAAQLLFDLLCRKKGGHAS